MAGTLIRGLGDGPGVAAPRALLIEDGRIAALDERAAARAGGPRTIDAAGLFAAPGFIDLQLNGIGGCDFTSRPESMWEVGPRLARRGITAFLPTIVTSVRGAVEAAIRAHADGTATVGATPLGLHVEGPFLSPVRPGAHPPDLLRPIDGGELDGWLRSQAVRVVTLAPELPDALAAIEEIAAAGVVAAVGHTDADAATTARAVDAGARYATHLFNAMPPFHHRAPGAVGALLADERVTVGLIADEHHLDPLVLALIADLLGRRVSLVSDAIAALDLEPGRHRLGSQEVVVGDGAARLADGTLAGSVAGLDECVRRFAAGTGSAAAALVAVTAVPARLLRLDDRGRLDVGSRADVVLLDHDLAVRATIVGGEPAYDADGRWA